MILWRPSFGARFERAQRFANTVLVFVGLGSVFVIGQALWCFYQARDLQAPTPLHTPSHQVSFKTTPHKTRVIWIILDELSYQQVYERRFPMLHLPAFDQLAAQATRFTQVRPAAERTQAAVPSLITGLRVDDIRAGADGRLLTLHNPRTGEWQPFHRDDTLFQDASNLGYSPAIAGWYIPYCRILPIAPDHCRWIYGEDNDHWMLPSDSVRSNTLASWFRIASYLEPNACRIDQFSSRMTAAQHCRLQMDHRRRRQVFGGLVYQLPAAAHPRSSSRRDLRPPHRDFHYAWRLLHRQPRAR